MTTAVPSKTPLALLVRVAVVPSLLVGAACALVGLLVADGPGFLGATVGALLAVGFFWTGQVVLHVARSIDPSIFLVIAMLTYILQVLILLAVFASFQRNAGWADTASPTALGVTIMACTAVWTVGLILAATRERIPLYDVVASPDEHVQRPGADGEAP